ncbi:MAG: phytoene desaturase family protein [Marmoricola sp.]
MTELDAVVVGAGPNGLTAAALLARNGLSVRVYEANDTVGGGARTAELTLPGFRHDVCSAVHPLGIGSPVFDALGLAGHGLEWVQPDLPMAHPFPEGPAAVLSRSVEETAAALGPDGDLYRRLVSPFVGHWAGLAGDLLRPPWAGWPHDPARVVRFAAAGVLPAASLPWLLRGERAPALFAGMTAHSMAPLGAPAGTGIALLFALAAHARGWPSPRGGSQAIVDALADVVTTYGGEVVTGHRVGTLAELPTASAYLLDVSPTTLERIAGPRLPDRFRDRLRGYRYGPGVHKVDYALSEPVPWTAPECRRAGTVHLGPRFADIRSALASVHGGRPPEPPFLITAQPSLVDPTRAPSGRHTFWAYAHVPHGWDGDFTDAVERQVERFAPGFRDLVLARHVSGPAALEAGNANYVGGDIACGSAAGLGLLLRPRVTPTPYSTPDPAVYLCSAATPPGPGVHGMCGYHAARVALRRRFGVRLPLEP